MHEISCPSCNATSQYNYEDYLQLCPFCSSTFSINLESGEKEIFANHFIIPNSIGDRQCRDLVLQWIKRIHHAPKRVDKEFLISDVKGIAMPFWIVSLEVNTLWKGFVRRDKTYLSEMKTSDYVIEEGNLRRPYRWAISARRHFCDHWGFTHLHEPKEQVEVEWDGFPLDSTFSRGRIDPDTGVKKGGGESGEELAAYESREYFDFKFSNGLPILAVQVGEEEAINRTRQHTALYHFKIAKANVHVPIDIQSYHDIAGIQLIHLPFWQVKYVYKPQSVLRYVQKESKKNVLVEGYTGGVLKSELSILKNDKVWINAAICGVSALIMVLFAAFAHPSFWFVAGFFSLVSAASAFVAISAQRRRRLSDGSGFFTSSEKAEAG